MGDKALARQLRKTGLALGRRVDVWRRIVALRRPEAADGAMTQRDPSALMDCLAAVAAATGNSPEGPAWREYLCIDAAAPLCFAHAAARRSGDAASARQALLRLTQTPWTAAQQRFVSSAPLAELREALWPWAAQPVGAAALLGDIERYEMTELPSDARRLAVDCQFLMASSAAARRELGLQVDSIYRNANVRIAVSERLLNDLMPRAGAGIPEVRRDGARSSGAGREPRQEPNGRADAARPEPGASWRWRLPAKSCFEHFAGRPGAVSQRQRIDLRRYEENPDRHEGRHALSGGSRRQQRHATARHQYSWDGIPIGGEVVRKIVKRQYYQNKEAASREMEQKLAARIRERVDAEAREKLSGVVERLNQRVFDPLNTLLLDPQLISAQTTATRFWMRLRLAGDNHLGSHTPRPQAPADSLASVQLHESVFANGIERMQLAGRTFTMPELSQHVAQCLNWPEPVGGRSGQRRREDHLRQTGPDRRTLPGRTGRGDGFLRPPEQGVGQQEMEQLSGAGVLPAAGQRPFGGTGPRRRDSFSQRRRQLALRGCFPASSPKTPPGSSCRARSSTIRGSATRPSRNWWLTTAGSAFRWAPSPSPPRAADW